MQISAKTRLICLIVALVFALGSLVGTGTYLIINHINKSNATTETTLSISGNLYNTDGSLNASAVSEFVDKLDFILDGAEYKSPTIADQAGVTATNSFIFQMGYVVSSINGSMTTRPITWQAVYARNGYLTIWMTQNYTISYFNTSSSSVNNTYAPFAGYTTRPSTHGYNHSYAYSTLRDSTINIYEELDKYLEKFDTIIATPTDANKGDEWQNEQPRAGYGVTSGLETNTGTANPQSVSWTSCMGDKFWVPSYYEAFYDGTSTSTWDFDGGLWGLSSTDFKFSDVRLDTNSTTSGYSNYCWLRSGYSISNTRAMLVNSSGSADLNRVNYSGGVRPAAHLSLTALEDALPPQYTVKVNSNNSNYGTVSISPSGGTYYEGTEVELKATPATGYQLKGWSTNGGSTIISGSEGKTKYTITVSGSYTYTAVFEPIMYTVITDVNIPEAGTVSGGGSYQQGSQATLTANLTNSNYKFIGWDTNGDNLVDISETFNPYKFTVSGTALVTAIFEKLPVTTITTNSSNYGRILYNNALISTSTQVVRDSGSKISNIYAIPNAGYAFLYWLDSATGQRYTDNPLDYTVSTDTTLTAVFGSSMTDGVAVVAENGGEARVSGYDETDATTIHVSAIAYKGYQFLGWYIMGEETPISTLQSDDLALSQVQNKIVIARFAPIENLDDMNTETDNGYNDDFV